MFGLFHGTLHMLVKKAVLKLCIYPKFCLSGLFIMLEYEENYVMKNVTFGLSHCYICPHVSGLESLSLPLSPSHVCAVSLMVSTWH